MDLPGPPTTYPDEDYYVDPSPRRDRRVEVVLTVVAAIVVIGAVLMFTRSPGPPTSPVGVQVEALTCETPCDLIDPRVTLAWTPPEAGADPTGYRLLRDGAPLEATLDASELTFVDDTVTMGERYAYEVIALSTEGDSAATSPVQVQVPTPPTEAAHLSGVYSVRLTVRKARSIGAAFGIENPLPGKRATDQWSFASTCKSDEGTCSSEWSGLKGFIEPIGSWWRGTVDGLPAECGADGQAPAPIEIDLETVDVGVIDGAWVVSGFRGTAEVSFHCAGFPPASATVEVIGAQP